MYNCERFPVLESLILRCAPVHMVDYSLIDHSYWHCSVVSAAAQLAFHANQRLCSVVVLSEPCTNTSSCDRGSDWGEQLENHGWPPNKTLQFTEL